jgi:hypothetical protein
MSFQREMSGDAGRKVTDAIGNVVKQIASANPLFFTAGQDAARSWAEGFAAGLGDASILLPGMAVQPGGGGDAHRQPPVTIQVKVEITPTYMTASPGELQRLADDLTDKIELAAKRRNTRFKLPNGRLAA